MIGILDSSEEIMTTAPRATTETRVLSLTDNETLCRVGRGTPMGEVFRRFWNPVCLSSQLPAPDCAPLRVEILGERLVAFRDSAGRIGLLDEGCPHRGASLALGRVEHGGIRCLFHGWKFDVEGATLETPNCADPRVRARVVAPSYPVREAGGMIWAYMGPADRQPPFPHWPFMDLPLENVRVARVDADVNYLQQLEGGADSSHVGILHANRARPGWLSGEVELGLDPDDPATMGSDDLAPVLQAERTTFGFHYAAVRRVPQQEGPALHNLRVVPIVMPSTRIIPSPALQFVIFEVPLNDTRTATFGATYRPDGQPFDKKKVDDYGGRNDPALYDHANHRYLGTWENRFGQDRAKMAEEWSGLQGIVSEDLAIAMSQGDIVDRTKEHLVPADLAVVWVRRQLLESAERVARGEDPIGVHADLSRVSACDATVPVDRLWQELVPGHVAETQQEARNTAEAHAADAAAR